MDSEGDRGGRRREWNQGGLGSGGTESTLSQLGSELVHLELASHIVREEDRGEEDRAVVTGDWCELLQGGRCLLK